MDGLLLVRKQAIHDQTTQEVTNARTNATNKTYPNLKARLDDIDTETANISNQFSQAIKGLYWKEAVQDKAGLNVYNADAKDGWCATVLDENAIYRYDEAQQDWVKISASAGLATSTNDGLMSSIDKDKLDKLDQNYVSKNGDSTITGTLTVTGGVDGNASSATRLETDRNITLQGDSTGTATFNGTADAIINVTHAEVQRNNTNADEAPNPGDKIVVVGQVISDNKGRITEVETKTITLPVSAGVDEKVKNEPNDSAKAYITGTISDTVSTGTQVFDTGVYLGDNPGELYATKFIGNLQGNADTATRSESADKLSKQVNINGTPFDGSADIVTDKWGNAKDITIGGQTISVDGSTNVNFDLPTIGASAIGHTQGANTIDTMTGYIKGVAGAIAEGDTLNEAIGKLEGSLDNKVDKNSKVNLTMEVKEYTVNQAQVNEIPLGVDVEATDVVSVYLSGVKLTPVKHYDLVIGAGSKITPAQGVQFIQDDHFMFEILKAELI